MDDAEQDTALSVTQQRAGSSSWEHVRAPRSLDFVTAAIPAGCIHSDVVRQLNTPQPELDDFTAIEWLREDGSPVPVLLAIFGPEQLATRVRDLLGAKLVAYIAHAPSTREVDEWARGDAVPSASASTRLAVATCAAALLSQSNAADVVQAWFQASNINLSGASPARVLRRDDQRLTGGINVLVAARRSAGVPL